MSRYRLFKKILPGLLPLIVFILVDEFYGTSAGLIVAVCFGIAQLIYSYLREKVFDKFTLYDTLLIVALGIVSYALDNDIFFKLKPALVGAILCVLLGISAFTKVNLLALMSKRYLEGVELKEEQEKQFKRSLRALFIIFSFHTLLVLYSAFFLSKEAWAFISTVLFYMLFGAYFIFELLKNWLRNRKYKNEEWLPLVDEKGNITGKAPRSVVHADKNLLHPVVHLQVVNSKKQLYLQKRPMSKLSQPGKWDASVTGHVAVNENVESALKREAKEEIGLENLNLVPVCSYILKTENESELVFLSFAKYDGEVRFNPDEVDDGRFWNLSEINSSLKSGIFTPGFLTNLQILKKNSLI